MENMVKTILVTGANGYIGTVLTEKLLKKGYKVIGWDTNFFKNILLGQNNNKCFSRKIDIRRGYSFKGVDCIIHLAALSNDPLGALNEKLTYDINYKSTIRLAKKAKKDGVKRLIFSSSCSVYGITENTIVSEKSDTNPQTAYAKSKVLTEEGLLKISDNNFSVCLLRNATVYGYSPRFRSDLVVNNLITYGLATGEFRVLSDGTPWRPLIDIRDLCDIFCNFISADIEKVNGHIFNIGFNNSNYRVKDIVNLIGYCLPKCKISFTKEHGKDTRSYKVNFSKLKKLFPFLEQKWPLERSVRDLINKLKKYNFNKNDFENGKYERLRVLKSLISEKKLTNNLYWRS